MTNASDIKVSVIIPVYNVETYLRECLDSVVGQTLKEIEIICIDDGSTDSSPEILREYADKHPGFTVLTQKNMYAGVARNKGMEIALGKYLCFLDSDDRFEPTMLEEAYERAEATHADMVLWGGKYFDDKTGDSWQAPWLLNKKLIKDKEVFSASDMPDKLFDVVSPAPWNKLFRADFVKKTGLKYQPFTCSNDIFFTYSSLALAERISCVPKELVHYRTGNANSLQATKKKDPETFLRAIIAIRNTLTERGAYDLVERAFLNMVVNNCAYNLRTFDDEEAYRHIASVMNSRVFSELGIYKLPEDYFFNSSNYKECMKVAQILPKLSVVIPAYNSEASIASCLDSLLREGFNALEIIVVDDGSSDCTAKIVQEYAERYLSVNLISLEENSGTMVARARGARRAHGEYVMFLDSDDSYTEGALARAYSAIKDADTDMLQFGMKILPCGDVADSSVAWLTNFMRPYCKKLSGRDVFEYAFKLSKYSFNITNKIYRRELIKRALDHLPSERLTIGEDMYFFFVVSYFADSFFGIEDELYEYHLGRGGMGKSRTTTEELTRHCTQVRIAELCDKFLELQGVKEKYEDVLLKTARGLLGECVSVFRRLPDEERLEGALILAKHWSKSAAYPHLISTLKQECPEAIPALARLADPSDADIPEGFERVIPVVFATNDAYASYAGVAIESILRNSAPDSYYRIYVLHSNISEHHIELLESYCGRGVSVKCLDVYPLVKSKGVVLHSKSHFTEETYFRFLIPEIFPFFDKVIYLDCDLIVDSTVDGIIPENMGTNAVAAAKNYGTARTAKRIAKDLEISSDGYFNAGVLVLNIPIWKNEKIAEQCFDYLASTPHQKLMYCDQDVLNVICLGRVVYLDLSWNFYWHLIYGADELVRANESISSAYRDSFKILHFASWQKPWKIPSLPLSRFFWKYARTSVFYEEILYANLATASAQSTGGNNVNKSTPVSSTSESRPASADDAIKRSFSYRLGRFITWLPRKIIGGFKCLEEHGFGYTWERVLVHLHLKRDPYKKHK